MKALELQAEMLEQLVLYQEIEIAEGGSDSGAVAANLKLYLTRFKPLPTADDLANLAAVLHGTCAEVAPVHTIRMVEEIGER